MKHKLFTLLIAVMANLGTMFAESGTCGDNLTWNLTDGVLTISGTGDMYNYGKRETPWDDYRFSIRSVIITDGVTTIGNHAFYYCTNLTSIEIPNSVTSVGWRAFNSCSSLISVTIPNNVTSISSEAFAFCSSLSSVSIGKSVTVIGSNAFLDCKKLTSVNINDIAAWCTIRFERGIDQAENMQYANPLYYAGNLYLDNTLVEDLVIPNGVTEIAFQAFADCKSITSVTIPEGVTCLGKGAFLGCSNLSSIKLPTSLTNLGTYTFSGCTGLTSIEIPDGVTSIGEYTFNNCTNLTSVVIPNSITHIGYEAFAYCRNLTSFTNHAATPQSMDTPFTMVTLANATLYVPAESIALYNAYPNWAKFGTIKAIGDDSTSCVVASGTCGAQGDNLTWTLTCDSVLTISGTGAMKDYVWQCTEWYSSRESIKSAVIENGATSIGNSAFEDCGSLTSVAIPNSVTNIGVYAFHNCSSLTSVTIPNSVTSIGKSAFASCSGLTSVTIGNSVTSIGNSAFASCSLTSVEIPNSVTGIGSRAFEGCSSLTSVTIPNSVTSIGNYAFSDCRSLTSIEFPNSITSIGSFTFSGCSGLLSVTIPNSVTNIWNRAFEGCSNLTSVTIPNSVTSIGDYAFYNCDRLKSIVFPNSLTTIGNHAFYCISLKSITNYAITPQTINANVLEGVMKSSCTLYVPAESVEAYQAADVWKEFGNILAIDDSTEEVNYATLADIYNMAADSTFTLGAFDVMYVPDFQSGSNMYIKDSTGSCVIYKVNYGLQAGDHVEAGLQGKVSIYNGLHEVIPITAKEELTITHGEAPAPMVATEVPSLNNASQYVVYEGVSFTTDTAFVEGRRHTVYGSWNGQTITFYNQYYIGATLSADKTYNITAVNTIYRTTPQAYPLAVEEVSPAPCIIASGTCGAEGDNLAWTLSCDSVLTISGTGRMANYVLTNSKSPAPWYTYHTAIKSVVIEDGVTSIGKNAFSECDMALVMMSGSVSAIADYAFSSCKKIISVDVAIDNQNYCSVDGILFNKNKTTLILYPAAKSDTSYSIPESVTRIGTASFEYCDSLSNIHIPNSVISIGRSAFYGSSTLTYIAIPNSVTSIEEGAFIDCRGLTSVTIGNSVTSIVSSAFSGCTGLTSIINYASTPQTITASVFNNVNKSTCTLYVPAESLAAYQAADVWKNFGTILPIEDTPETGKVVLLADVANYIDFQALSISEPKMVESTITSTNFYTLANGTKLVGFVNSDGSEVANSWVVDEGYYTNRPTPEWKGVDSLRVGTMFRAASGTTIELGAFSVSEASKLVVYFSPNGDIERGISVSIFGGEPVAFVRSGMKINGTRPAYAAEFDLPVGNYEESDVTIKIIRNTCNIFGIGIHNIEPEPCILASGTCGAEGDNLTWTLTCDSLLTISGTGAMEDYSSNSNWPWYSYRESITSIVVEDGVTRLGSFAFDYLVNVTSITLPNTVTQIGWYSIGHCYKLTSITIPASVTYISGSAFSYCEKLTAFNVDQNNSYYSSVDGVLFNKNQTQIIRYPIGKEGTHYTIPNTVVSIYDGAFASTKLESINMPNGIIEIGGWAFSNCTGLVSVVLPDQVSYIGTYAFSYCRNLESVTIPMSVTNIANGAFIACDNLKTVTNYSTIPQRVDSACFSYFGGGYYITTSTLYVPAQSVAAYQAADVWKDFGNILPIEGDLPIEPTEGEFNVLYVGQEGDFISSEAVMLHLPVAPEIAGFTFLKWQVVAGDLENGIIIQAVYQTNEYTSAPEVYTNPANPAQKLIRNGNVYILTDDKIYSITGQTVR